MRRSPTAELPLSVCGSAEKPEPACAVSCRSISPSGNQASRPVPAATGHGRIARSSPVEHIPRILLQGVAGKRARPADAQIHLAFALGVDDS